MKEKLRTLFQQKFNPIEYRKVVLQNLLHTQQLLSQPQFLEETNDGDRIYGLGYLTDADGKQIGLYYTDVVNSDVRRKRVGFRQMMKKYTDFGVDAAIAVFSDKEHWRLSYMSDLKGGETSAKRFSYILGDLNGQYNTPVNRLAKLGTQVPHLRLKDIFEAFSVETLSDEFFDLYRDHYADIVEYLTGKRMVKVDNKWVEKVIHAPLQSVYEQLTDVENADKIVRDYVKKMMGRIVFLHFLQKKGWLNGDTNFMQHTFSRNESCQDDFLEKILEPLFFGFLNTRKVDRAKLFDKHPNWDKQLLTVWENIPYLNGGLFEQDEVDNLNIRLPRSMFDDLFKFLADYNFTVDENDPDDAEVGVDPEMLGKIFESLLEDNKAKGAFYTPKEIVRYMCKESLIAYLDSKVNSEIVNSESNASLITNNESLVTAVRRFVEHHEMHHELEPYRDILDVALRNVKICDPAIGSGAFPMGLLNELWRCREALEPSVVSQVTDHRSQLKKQIIENNIYGVDIERGAIDIARLRFWLSIVVDAEEPEPLPNFDYKFMQGNSLIESYKGIDLSRISNRLRGGQSKSTQLLLGLDSDFSKKNLQRLMRDYFSVTDHKQKASMRQAINDEVKHLITDFIGGTAADLDKLDPSANQDFFLWHTWFKDIFDNGGFDIVIANPPYISIRTKNFPVQLKEMYKKTYSLAVGQYDVYTLFIEHGCRILSKHGILSYIIPTRMLSNENFKPARDYVNNNIPIFSYVNAEAPFETASVEANIMICKKGFHVDSVDCYRFSPSEKTFNRISTIAYSDISIMPFGIFPFTYEDKVIRLLNKIQNVNSIELGYYLAITRGFECGYNNPVIGIGEMPFIKSENIKAYYPAPSNLVCNPDFTNTTVYKTEQVFCNKPKLITKFCSDKIQFSLDEVGYCNTNSVYNCTQKEKCDINYLLAILNSKVTTFWFNTAFMNIDGLFPHIQKNQLEAIPIPVVRSSYQTITDIVEQIIDIKRKDPSADTSKLEQEIDQQVYTLYSLTPEEIAIIEQQ